MKLTKRSNGIYMVSYKDADGKRKRTSTGAHYLPEAICRATEILAKARDCGMTMFEAVSRFDCP